MQNAIEALTRRLEAIGQLSPEGRATLAALPLQFRSLRKGEDLVGDGEVSTSCCVVLDGYLYRSKDAPNGARQIFSLHPAGDMPDLHSLHLPRMDHNLTAMSESRVAQIPHAEMNAALVRSPELTALFWRSTLIDAAAFRAWMLMLGQFDAITRMAHLFCEQFTKAAMAGLADQDSFFFPLTQTDLADMLGISLVHANRTLQDLRERGVVAFDHNRVSILHWSELRRIGEFDPAYLHYLDGRIGRRNPGDAHNP
ncbi:Crp/Fnr family transcriptional regulator [Devosia salina]|uniref:Crp/Fnr family transcriptional regulator n=1 Tax=Devosia salina TaxID=2860336 RepID=A0ABX8WBC2_9HYPH|nr:Crp/Fnr family transcriptional regulator [Devosia salina]QYO76078.1 Crp/Fnr family transcriptional regulator [Devosia salina]